MTQSFLTDRTTRQQARADMVARLFAGANAPDLSGSSLELPERIGQRPQMREARQSPSDLRDAFLKATGQPSRDADCAWQDNADHE